MCVKQQWYKKQAPSFRTGCFLRSRCKNSSKRSWTNSAAKYVSNVLRVGVNNLIHTFRHCAGTDYKIITPNLKEKS